MRLRVLLDSYIISSCASPLQSRQMTLDMHYRRMTGMRLVEGKIELAGPARSQHAREKVLNRAHGHHAVVWNVIQFIQFNTDPLCFERRPERPETLWTGRTGVVCARHVMTATFPMRDLPRFQIRFTDHHMNGYAAQRVEVECLTELLLETL